MRANRVKHLRIQRSILRLLSTILIVQVDQFLGVGALLFVGLKLRFVLLVGFFEQKFVFVSLATSLNNHVQTSILAIEEELLKL